MSAGLGYSLGLRADGSLWAWGYNAVGKGFGGKNEDDEYFNLLADT